MLPLAVRHAFVISVHVIITSITIYRRSRVDKPDLYVSLPRVPQPEPGELRVLLCVVPTPSEKGELIIVASIDG